MERDIVEKDEETKVWVDEILTMKIGMLRWLVDNWEGGDESVVNILCELKHLKPFTKQKR